MSTPAFKPDSPAYTAASADMDSTDVPPVAPTGKVPKVAAFSMMDPDAQSAHLTEMHHPGTVDASRHFMTHITKMVPVPHVHAKAAKPQ